MKTKISIVSQKPDTGFTLDTTLSRFSPSKRITKTENNNNSNNNKNTERLPNNASRCVELKNSVWLPCSRPRTSAFLSNARDLLDLCRRRFSKRGAVHQGLESCIFGDVGLVVALYEEAESTGRWLLFIMDDEGGSWGRENSRMSAVDLRAVCSFDRSMFDEVVLPSSDEMKDVL